MRKKTIILFLTMGALMLSGCNTKIGNTTQQTTESSTTTSSSVTETDTSDMFSDRDKEVGYDESESVTISLADNSSSCESDAVSITENTITIKDEGTYILSGSLSDGMVIVEAEDTDKVQIVLNGVSISNNQSAAFYVRSADKVFVSTASGTENTLEHSESSYTAIDENNIDAAIFSKSDLTLNGEGTLTVTAQEGHGIVSKDDLVLTSGTYVITSASHGLSGKDSVRIANGSYTIVSGKDGIHAQNKDDSSSGFVYLAGGTYTISAGDDGIHAASNVTISDGKIDITQSYEGIEGLSIDIAGGEISVLASDDGINAAGGNDSSSSEGFQGGDDQFASTEGAYIQISGGVLYVNASGDGIDSNGDITVSGGETYVSGPTNDGNGSLDYNGSAQITGGIFAASGSSGMAQNFDSSSTQGTIMVNIDEQEGNTEISLLDSSSTELLSWTAEKQYSSIIISTPEIQQGETYTITAGAAEQSITMDSLVYGSNAQGEMPGNGGERGDMKGSDMQGGPGNGQPDANMEKPQGSTPPNAPSDSK
ncbi:carbohydrate-binding domain-containing protein [Mediterraneibacter faecis]|uniref:carbohydrate-binding domain-containing protein n=1 Tax=Mediterraneibacter faecis TaxID=592978 RepID=UPI0032BFBED2